jgi:hypothetical protein
MKLKPLTDLTGDKYHRRVLMVHKDPTTGCAASAYMGTMAGVHTMQSWGSVAPPLPDGYVEPIEIEDGTDADHDRDDY